MNKKGLLGILGSLGAVTAAPFTAGTSLSWLPAVLGAAGTVAGSAAKGSADQRTNENSQIAQRNALLTQIWHTQQNAKMNAAQASSAEQNQQAQIDMARRNYAMEAPSIRASQAVRGNLMQNIQPASFQGLPERVSSHIPTLSGGLTPASLGPEARQMGELLARQAVLGQLKGDTFDPLQKTDFNAALMPAPTLQDMQQPGGLEKTLGGLGLVGSLLGSVGAMAGRRRPSYEPNDQNGWG